MKRISLIAATVATVATVVLVGSGVLGAGEGGRVELLSPMRTKDTRIGTRVTTTDLGSGVLSVWALDPTGPGSALIHPCADSAPVGEATFRFSSVNELQYARFASAEDVCLTASEPVHVIVDSQGTVSATPETVLSQYVASATPVVLMDEATIGDRQITRIDRPSALSSDATAAVLAVEVLTSEQPGYLQAYPCSDSKPPLAVDLAYHSNRVANVAYVPIAPGDDLCIHTYRPAHVRVRLLGELNDDGPDPAALPPSWRYVPGEVPAPSLRSIVPVRVLDTRAAIGRPGTSKVEADEVVELDFGELVGPQTTAVVLNVTVDQPESAGFVTAWPCGGQRPTVSNLNFAPGETVPNLVVSKLGPARSICLSGVSRTHLVADLNGTYETDGGLMAVPVTPDRVLDTRDAIGVPTTTKLTAGQTLELQMTGAVVPDEAGAVTVNVTATEADEAGFITAYPCGSERPEASNLNYAPGQSVANLVTAKLSNDGRLCLYTLATTHLIADIATWYGLEQPAGLIELAPERFLDTREAIGVATTSKVGARKFIQLQIGGRGDVDEDATAVVMNLTVTEPEAAGFLTAWPCGDSMPTVSNVNYGPNETNPNLATVKLSPSGTVCIYTLARAHIVADVAGYLTEQLVDGQALTLE